MFPDQPSITLLPPIRDNEIHTIVDTNPLLAALLLSSTLGIPQKSPGFNHPQHLPINPYVALLLSHYGRYLPLYGTARGIYGYTAANNYHNNKPFGSYKIYEDRDNWVFPANVCNAFYICNSPVLLNKLLHNLAHVSHTIINLILLWTGTSWIWYTLWDLIFAGNV